MIILASQSPRRKELLEEILGDIPFEVCPSSFEERKSESKDVRKLCLREAQGKGYKVSLSHPGDYVISADTRVSFKGQQLGKPKDEEDVFHRLRELSGNTHEVITAYAIYLNGKELKHRICQSKLFMEKRADREIQEYIDTGSPFDKAGAYGIQDKDFINAKIIDGSYENIRGLPIDELEEDLVSLGILK